MTPDTEQHIFHGEIIPPDDFWMGDAEFQAQEAFRRLIRACGSRTTAMRFWFEIPKQECGDETR